MGKRNHLYKTGKGFAKILKGKIKFDLLDKFNENVAILDKFKNVVDNFAHKTLYVNNAFKEDICKYYIHTFLDRFPTEKFVIFATNSFNKINQSKIFSNLTNSINTNTTSQSLRDMLKEFKSSIKPGLLICYPLKLNFNLPFAKQIIHYDIPSDTLELLKRLSIFKFKHDEILSGQDLPISLILHNDDNMIQYNSLIANMSNKFKNVDPPEILTITKYFINRHEMELIRGVNLKVDVSKPQLDNAAKLLNIYGIDIVKSALHKLDRLPENDAWRSPFDRRYNYASVLIRDKSHSVILSRSHLKQFLYLHVKDDIDTIGKINHDDEGFVVEMPLFLALKLVKTPLITPEEWDVQTPLYAEILQRKPSESEIGRKKEYNTNKIIKGIKRKLSRGYITSPKTRRTLLKRMAAASEKRMISLLRRRAKLGLLTNTL